MNIGHWVGVTGEDWALGWSLGMQGHWSLVISYPVLAVILSGGLREGIHGTKDPVNLKRLSVSSEFSCQFPV